MQSNSTIAVQPHQELTYESHFASLEGGDQLHLRRIYCDPGGEPVLLIHGFIENGRIFYTEKGKGYAPFLARQGYDVFVADLRGRGKSTPRIHRGSDFGQQEFLNEEFPAFVAKVVELKGNVPMHWAAHSWGGVMLLAYLALHEPPVPIRSMVLFGSKRHISVRNWTYYWMIYGVWRLIFPFIIRRKGYVEAVKYKMGGDNESAKVFFETDQWVREKEWHHWVTGEDLSALLNKKNLPPTLYFAGQNDKVLGHPIDVQLLADETGEQHRHTHLLSRENGHLLDYGHIDMMTHPKAKEDHFPMALKWMQTGSI